MGDECKLIEVLRKYQTAKYAYKANVILENIETGTRFKNTLTFSSESDRLYGLNKKYHYTGV